MRHLCTADVCRCSSAAAVGIGYHRRAPRRFRLSGRAHRSANISVWQTCSLFRIPPGLIPGIHAGVGLRNVIVPWGSVLFRRFSPGTGLCASIREHVSSRRARWGSVRVLSWRVMSCECHGPHYRAGDAQSWLIDSGGRRARLSAWASTPTAEWGTMLGEGRQYIFRALC